MCHYDLYTNGAQAAAGVEYTFVYPPCRSDSEEDQQQRSGRRSRSPRPPRCHSQDQFSQSDSCEEWARGSRSPGSSASSLESRKRSRSPGAAALALSQQQSLQERLRLREERKQQEELLKAFETPEEKRARRLAKKEAKERKKREKMGWGEEYMGYTNTDNPFGDNNLLGTFIWNKVGAPASADRCCDVLRGTLPAYSLCTALPPAWLL